MRVLLLTSLALLMAGCASNRHPQFRHGRPPGGFHDEGVAGEGPRGRVFISPMGEPFRGQRGGPDPQDIWFQNADIDHDGALSRAEFSKDASRFFAVLDRRHDGEIDPDDIDYYETVLAPEVRVGGSAGGGGGRFAGGGGRAGGGHRGGGGRGGAGGHRGGSGADAGGSGPQAGAEARATYGRQGAARFSYFDFPEPVTIADTNFNRGVDAAEFQHAADLRFTMLDKNGDGRIEHNELPRIASSSGGGRGRSGAAPRRGDDPTVRSGDTP